MHRSPRAFSCIIAVGLELGLTACTREAPPLQPLPEASIECASIGPVDDEDVEQWLSFACMADDAYMQRAVQTLRPWFDQIAPRITNEQAVALSRASTLTARSFARELLDQRRLWTPELVDESFGDFAHAGTPVLCFGPVVQPGWLHGMRALMSMSDIPWARARLTSILHDELRDYVDPPEPLAPPSSKPHEHVTMLAAAIRLLGSSAGGRVPGWLRAIATNRQVPAELRQAGLDAMRREHQPHD